MLLKGVRGPTKSDRAVPLDLRLQAISDRIPASSIDELWVFPPLPNREVSCEFVVLICFDGGEDQRRILTSHVDAQFSDPESEKFELVQRVRQQGRAPHRWVADIPDRLLGRLADAGVPEIVEVGGRTEAWEEALTRFTNGNGNGNGNGHGLSARHDPLLVDSRVLPEVSFSTIIEGDFLDNGSGSDS